MITQEQFNVIVANRIKANKNDGPEFQSKANKLLNYLSEHTQFCRNFKVLEMYPQESEDPIKSKIETYNFFNRWHNTRTKIPSETRAEIDKLPAIKAQEVIAIICSNLMEKGIHFAVFYADGARSPHVVIYDFYDLEQLTPFEREKAQEQFWRMIAGFYYCFLDKGIWCDEHFVPMEFRPHWKYKTTFDLFYEYVPNKEETQCKV